MTTRPFYDLWTARNLAFFVARANQLAAGSSFAFLASVRYVDDCGFLDDPDFCLLAPRLYRFLCVCGNP